MGFIKSFVDSLNPHIRKLIRNYNVVERADKVLDKEKRPAPPLHPGTGQKFKVIIKTIPDDVREKLDMKSDALVNRLKDITIEASDAPTTAKSTANNPQDRYSYQMPEFGYQEPTVMPKGKCSLRQAVNFISKNQSKHDDWTSQQISKKFDMLETDVRNVLENFKVCEIYLRSDKNAKENEQNIVISTLGVLNVRREPKKTNYERMQEKKEIEGKLSTDAKKE